MPQNTVSASSTVSRAARAPAGSPSRPTPDAQARRLLAIEGLPSELAGLARGMLYAIAVDTQPIRVALAAQSLSGSASVAAPAMLVTGHEPAALVKKAASFAPRLVEQLGAGSARILRLEADISRRLLRYGSAKLIDDLRAQDIADNALVIFDNANKVLGLGDPASAEIASQLFQSWADASGLSILFLVETHKDNPREYATLKRVAEHWGGLAVARSSASRATVTFKHWYGQHGLTPGGRFQMGLADQGHLGVIPSTGRPNLEEDTVIAPSSDHQALIGTREALAGLGQLNLRAQACDDPLELLDRARRVRGGTVLLHFSERKELDRLIKLVANLRSITAPQVRIVIREVGAKLRRTENHALLQLGASFVLPKDVPAESAHLLIEQLGTAALSRVHNPRAAEQLQALLHDSSGRLLTPYDFRLRVTNLLDLSDAALPHTLVSLNTPVAGLATRIANLISPRIRDVMFTDVKGRLLLFLFGCNAEAADVVMKRLFVTRSESSKSWRCTSDSGQIRDMLSQIDVQSVSAQPPVERESRMIRETAAAERRTL